MQSQLARPIRQRARIRFTVSLRSLPALVFLALVLAGTVEMVESWRDAHVRAVLPKSALDTVATPWTSRLEKKLVGALPSNAALIAVANSARYLALGDGGDQVRVGDDGWLFLADELRYTPDGPKNRLQRARWVAQVDRSLAERDIALVVALVPDKARVYARFLRTGRYPAYNQTRYRDFLGDLRALGVDAVNLAGPLDEAATAGTVFWRTDTHWNERGARIAAGAVAARVSDLGLPLPATHFKTTLGPPAPRPGDLLRLMGLQTTPDAFRPPADQHVPATTQSTDAAASLFGDAGFPVALVGTSFSTHANFLGFLEDALSAKVLDVADDGGGFAESLVAYLNNPAFEQSPPRLVVWEIPERYVDLPLKDDRALLARSGLTQ